MAVSAGNSFFPRVSSSALKCLFSILIIINQVLYSSAHVALTFPPARKYNLDFLDNIRTPGLCGMPAGLSAPYNLESGSSLNITWYLGYAHKGGYRLELRAQNDSLLSVLAPTDPSLQYTGSERPTSASQFVQLPPSLTCESCYIRLLRQAVEWRTGSPEGYLFRSCADVNIVPKVDELNQCSMKGYWTGERCVCEKYYYGDKCQYENECEADSLSDCGDHGSCITVSEISALFAAKQCYCQAGWFGPRCSLQSKVTTLNVDPKQYRSKQLGAVQLYWKIEGDEIDVVMRAQTDNWIGIGWRPAGMDGSCRAQLPLLVPTAESPAAGNRKVPIHAMDCTDLVVGTAKGRLFRVGDYYTRDRSTPRMDENYGGIQNLLGAIGVEDNGITTIRWRRKLESSDSTDHSILPGLTHVIWAIGQEAGNYKHRPASGLENSPSEESKNFYKRDELKYHGHEGRGVAAIDFYNVSPPAEKSSVVSDADKMYQCRGKFSSPAGCKDIDCQYVAKWQYLPSTDSIWFMVQTKNDANWHGIGFSDDKKMPNSDVIITWLRGAQLRVSDMWISEYTLPEPDQIPSITNVTAKLVGPNLRVDFIRPRKTGDAKDFQFSDDQCAYFIFPTHGGGVNPEQSTISKHDVTPIFSEKKICIVSCEMAETAQSVSAEPAAEPEVQAESPASEPEAEHEPSSSSEPASEPEAKTEPTTSEPVPEPEQTVKAEPESKSEPPVVTSTETSANRNRDQSNVIRSCGGRWKYPTNCNLDCDYVASWVFEQETDSIKFLIQTRHVNKWTGIGFSTDRRMPLSDAIYAFARPDGSVAVIDGYLDGYSPPQIDANQDLYQALGFVENDLMTVTFTRKRETMDIRDVSFADPNNCPYMFFPVEGGAYDPTTGSIAKHLRTPYVSTARICVELCAENAGDNDETVALSTQPSVEKPEKPVIPPRERPAAAGTFDGKEASPTPDKDRLAPNVAHVSAAIEGSVCRARFRFPPQCTGPDCFYIAEWEYLPDKDEIAFILRSRDLLRWTGIGFSDDREKAKADIIVGWVEENGRVRITDRTLKGLSAPVQDSMQNINNLRGKIDDNFQLLAFFRPAKTNDPNDFQFGNISCPYFVFPIVGGPFTEGTENVGAQNRAPFVTDRRICIGPCVPGASMSPYKPEASASSTIKMVDATTEIPKVGTEAEPEFSVTAEELDYGTTESETTPEATYPTSTSPEPTSQSTSIVTETSESTTASSKSALSGSLFKFDCEGIFSYPDNCDPEECQYIVQWRYDDLNKTITFKMEYADASTWVGIGFDDVRRKGPPRDAIYAFRQSDGKVQLIDASHTGSLPASRDFRQDAKLEAVGDRDGRLLLQFSRPLVTRDSRDYQFDESGAKCPYFYFPVKGGSFDESTLSVGPANGDILVSAQPICIKACEINETETSSASTSEPETTTSAITITRRLTIPVTKATEETTVTSTTTQRPTPPPEPVTPISERPVDGQTSASGGTSCIGLFKYPYECNGKDCLYWAQWEHVTGTAEVRFTLLSSAAQNWTGIGFSDTRFMPNSDIIYGWVNDGGELILIDGWASAREPPKPDNEQNINRAIGRRQAGLTQITFSRNFVTGDTRDYQFTETACPYLMFPVQSARYDESSNTIAKHWSRPLVSTVRVCLATCYDGVSTTVKTTEAPEVEEIPFVPQVPNVFKATKATDQPSESDCYNSWRFPRNCKSDLDCIYVATWRYLDDRDAINFTIRAKTLGDTWTGIGFSDDKTMPNSDIILGWVKKDNGRVIISDRHTQGHTGAPLDTSDQSVRDFNGRREGDFTEINFIRKRKTSDSYGEDYQFSDMNCPYLFFPVFGGSYSSDITISAHSATNPPLISEDRVCIRSCEKDYPRSVFFKLRITNEKWDESLRNTDSTRYLQLKNKILSQVRSVIGNRRGVSDIKIRGFEKGSVVAYIDVIFEPIEDDSKTTKDLGEEVKNELERRVIEDNAIGNLQVDPNSFDVSAPEPVLTTIAPPPETTQDTTTPRRPSDPDVELNENDIETDEPSSNITGADVSDSEDGNYKIYIIVAVVCGLVLIIIIIALVKYIVSYRARKRRRKEKMEQNKSLTSGWVDYSAVGRNPVFDSAIFPNGGKSGAYRQTNGSSAAEDTKRQVSDNPSTKAPDSQPIMQERRQVNESSLDARLHNGEEHTNAAQPSTEKNVAEFYFIPSQRRW